MSRDRLDKADTDPNRAAYPEGQGKNPESRPVGAESCPASSSWTNAESSWLMEQVVATGNMQRAYQRVMRNKGAPGADGMTVVQLADHLKRHWPVLRERLRAGRHDLRHRDRVSVERSARPPPLLARSARGLSRHGALARRAQPFEVA